MAPAHSKLRSSPPSSYIFSAAMTADGLRPTVIECVAPSPPRRVRGVELTITRVFKTPGVSLKRFKDAASPSFTRSATPGSAQRLSTPAPEAAPAGVSQPSSSAVPSVVSRARGSVDTPGLHATTSSISTRITRSASYAAIKGSSKLGRRSSMAAIDSRLDPDGAIVTRYGEQDGEPIFIRQERVTSTTEPEVVTYFWESFTAVPLCQPPDLTAHPDLTAGDLYSNIVRGESKSVQLWMWTVDAEGAGAWKRVREGDVREDGRRLTVTPKRQQPSWVSPNWGVKQLRNQRAR
ncbi:hypothetical protein L226DRAFT_577049 [Lentinus tigrinus ALCF2SS1-7]|uniref:Uncharacterized protein n=1 Tax=Lentinus tigrinus ALCF2SS1-6 TaxID=1328759 RepID=A0A5C2S944_9APHY|nr:hypothetical protein L227DRAFT_611281 [Lentinus tigrinus ALCF2SS1-6]RPD67674.1 hypothetical protein L226DRAFT_577049 [Lentinus tigrinus ALCF2SS1-7]